MGYLFSIDGEIPIESSSDRELDSIVNRVHGGLLALGASRVEVSGRTVTYRCGLFDRKQPFRYDRLATDGHVEVGPQVLRYEFSTQARMLIHLVLIGVVAVLLLAETDGSSSVLYFAPVALAFLVVHYTIERMRLVTFLRLAVGAPADGAATSDYACPICGEPYDPSEYEYGVDHYCEHCHNVLPRV